VRSGVVSVVIPAFNAEAFIGECIGSALSQTYPQVEVIVVDDGSTDATASVVARFGTAVRCLRQANARQAAARNAGIKAASGEFVAFLDADDVWRPEKLERQLALFEERPELGLVYCSVEEIDPHGKPLGLRRAALRGRAGKEILLGRAGNGICGSTPVVPRRVFDLVGDFDVTLPPCEDMEFFWRVADRLPIDFVDEPLVGYRVHAGNAHKNLRATTRAWKLLYRKALREPGVRSLGLAFRLRCLGRLYYMLSGDHALAGRWLAALGYALRAGISWPPAAGQVLGRLTRRLGA
jgi:glycosyltransferase involved in cell wall biosynthesis